MSDEGHHHHHHHHESDYDGGNNYRMFDQPWNDPTYLNLRPRPQYIPQKVPAASHADTGPKTKLPFSSKIVAAFIICAPLLYLAHLHLDYNSEAHPPKDNNPVSYLAYGLHHADKDINSAVSTVGAASDHLMSGLDNGTAPAEKRRAAAPVRTIGAQYPIDLCVPADLVDNQSWDSPAPGSKMAEFRGALKAFILASGNPNVQYRVKDGAFENFNSASNPASLVYGVSAGSACPANDYRYTIPVMR